MVVVESLKVVVQARVRTLGTAEEELGGGIERIEPVHSVSIAEILVWMT